jgi:hypothetical protein
MHNQSSGVLNEQEAPERPHWGLNTPVAALGSTSIDCEEREWALQAHGYLPCTQKTHKGRNGRSLPCPLSLEWMMPASLKWPM